MAKQVTYIADDFGMGHEINDAILYSHTSGHLTGTALMMGQIATNEAVQLAHQHPTLQIGWHLHLDDSQPTTTDHWPWHSSTVQAGFSMGLVPSSYRLMRNEVARQWELFQETGLKCSFINSHHHLHAHPFVYRAIQEVVGPDYPGWIRLGRPHPFQHTPLTMLWSALGWTYLERRRKKSLWHASDTLWGLDRIFNMKADEIRAVVPQLPDGLHEFLFHPRTRTCPDSLCLLDLKSSPPS